MLEVNLNDNARIMLAQSHSLAFFHTSPLLLNTASTLYQLSTQPLLQKPRDALRRTLQPHPCIACAARSVSREQAAGSRQCTSSLFSANAPSTVDATSLPHAKPSFTPSDLARNVAASMGSALLLLLCVSGGLSPLLTAAQPCEAYGLTSAGRLDKCRGDDACVSTSSVGNPSKFGPPWSFQPETDDGDVAWESLKEAVRECKDHGEIVEESDGPALYYLHAEFPSFLGKGVDDVEFKLNKEERLVTYRSSAREPFYIYPLQTPINTDKNKTRLADIRLQLGWVELAGYDLYGRD